MQGRRHHRGNKAYEQAGLKAIDVKVVPLDISLLRHLDGLDQVNLHAGRTWQSFSNLSIVTLALTSRTAARISQENSHRQVSQSKANAQ